MGSKDWEDAWQRGDIGFHQNKTNAFLEQHGAAVWGQTPGRVLVPLCGKSLDMVHLASTADAVIGVEFVEQAVREFFDEQTLTPEVDVGPPLRFTAGPYTVFAADFFSIMTEHTGPIDSVFDRASIVALDPETRVRYAEHLTSLLPTGAVVLLVTFSYDQAEMQGPPFSVPEAEVTSLFANSFDIEHLATENYLNDGMRANGLSAFDAHAYKLIRR